MGKGTELENIILMSCRSPFLDDSKIYPPLANLYLKSFVNAHRPHIKIDLGDDEYDENTDFSKYDAVGISIMTPQRKEADLIAELVKRSNPKTKVIVGGPHIKYYLEETIKNPYFDYIVHGDGEKELVNILEGYPERIQYGNMSKREIKDAPPPDRTSPESINLLSRYNYSLNGRECTTMMTGRGCPERCTFCEDARTSIKWSSIDNLKKEMDDIVDLGYGAVYIFDDLFAISKKMITPIVEELYFRDLIFRCNAQARHFTKDDEEMAKLLSENGCYEIAFGAETGSQDILDNIDKRTTVKQNYQTVEYAKRHGIRVKAFILLGLPGENLKTLNETEEFIKNSGIDDFQCAIYMPYKGTEIRRQMDNNEEIDLEMTVMREFGAYGVKGGNTVSEVRTKDLSSDDLKEFRDYLVKKYKPQAHDKFFETKI